MQFHDFTKRTGNAPEPDTTEAKSHEDYAVDYSHEMPAETREASGRFVVLVVPLLYGLLLGGLLSNILIGLLLGVLASLVVDLALREQSLFAPLLRRLLAPGCPFLAILSQLVVRVTDRLGLKAPDAWRNMRCGASR